MRVTVILLVALLLAPAGPAQAEESAGCLGQEAVADLFVSVFPGGESLLGLEGDEAARLIALLNDLPPRTSVPGDSLLVLLAPGRPGVAFVEIFQAGCRSGGIKLPLATLRRLQSATAGQEM